MEFQANVTSFNSDGDLFHEENFTFDISFDIEDDEAEFSEDDAIEAFFTADFDL